MGICFEKLLKLETELTKDSDQRKNFKKLMRGD